MISPKHDRFMLALRGIRTPPRRRVDVRAILRDPVKRRELMIETIIATQARAGITTTREQAEAAYDKVMQKRSAE